SRRGPAPTRSTTRRWVAPGPSTSGGSTPRTASWSASRRRSEGRPLASVAEALAAPRSVRHSGERASTALSLGFVTAFLSVVVALPMAALVWASSKDGANGFWSAVTNPEAVAALKLSLVVAALATVTNAVLGTVTAWVLVRDDFRGKSIVNAVIDLPFALPTIVAGLVPLTLYRPRSPVPG